MKKIILNTPEKKEALASALKEAQRRCTARTLDVDYVIGVLAGVEKRLDIPKAHLKGVKVWYCGAEHFPSAYKYKPESTHFGAEHNGKCWVITDIHRDACPNQEDDTKITLTEDAQAAVIARLTAYVSPNPHVC